MKGGGSFSGGRGQESTPFLSLGKKGNGKKTSNLFGEKKKSPGPGKRKETIILPDRGKASGQRKGG